MSDIPRYRPVSNDRYGITDDADGKLCEYRDYARLKAEVERLEAFTTRTIIPNEELQAQVERLTKAGDATLGYLLDYVEPTDGYLTFLECRANWNAAKEGKQP